MKNIIIEGVKITFDTVIEFKQHDTKLIECFFFRNEKLLNSAFLTPEEIKKLK